MTPEQLEKLRAELIRDEALRLMPYVDTVGKVTIGVGRNLTDKGITNEEANLMLDNDIQEHLKLLDDNLEWWRTMTDNRQRVLANMAFNMGVPNLITKNPKMLALMKAGAFVAAGNEVLNGPWSSQVKGRAFRISEQLKTGKWK